MGLTQYNRTDPDAKIMVKPAHNLMAYNVQIAVDNKYKFIVATDVSSKSSDLDKLYNMSKKSKEITNNDKIIVVADRGYDSPKEIKKSHDDNIEVIVPIVDKQKAQKDKGKFTRDTFIYDSSTDTYICPNKSLLTRSSTIQKKNGKVNILYQSKTSICINCPIKENCLPSTTHLKRIFRWEYQEVMDNHKKKM